jgi:alpha-N-acetylglucosaminidase
MILMDLLVADKLFIAPKSQNSIHAASELVKRIVPDHCSQLRLEEIPDASGKDVFEIDIADEQIVLRGNNPVAIASALNWYLKYTCHVMLSWNGDNLALPATLPLPVTKIRKLIQPDYRVFFNYCTFSYSMVWWDWKRWEREIDFLAMNGINMPLTVVGLEAVWYNSLLRVGFSDEEARSFLVGPAFLAWQWMTNIESYAGPLPKSWIEKHITLGQQIIQRELELGMKPIQQGFSGYVPLLFKEKFPNANIQVTAPWNNFPGCAQLNPLDPLFMEFGKIFLEEEMKLFGMHGYYAADPFHESMPPKTDKTYLNKVGATINRLIEDFDPNSVWVIQAWSIRKDIIQAVPKHRLLVLDLKGNKHDTTEEFWGYPFVLGKLHNFGNRINLHGDLAVLAANKFMQFKKTIPNEVGSGIFMEGILQNPIYYELAFEMPFYEKSIDLNNWLNAYARRRFATNSIKAGAAMQLLLATAYKPGTNNTENSSIIAARPAIQVKKSGPNAGFNIPYPPLQLEIAFDLLLEARTDFLTDGYLHDIVDIKRQVLTNLGQEIHKKAAAAYQQKDLEGFDKHSGRFLQLLRDIDALTATRPALSFDKWIDDAHSWATTEEEKQLYDFNASMLVTQWGPYGDRDATIFDYSWREWGGLINGYYLLRWELFYTMLRNALVNNEPYSEEGLELVHGREKLRANAFYDGLANRELEWIQTVKITAPVQSGKEMEIVMALHEKYKPMLVEYYGKH